LATRDVYEQARRTKEDLVSLAKEIGVHVIEVDN